MRNISWKKDEENGCGGAFLPRSLAHLSACVISVPQASQG
jgi:hypothetical protein